MMVRAAAAVVGVVKVELMVRADRVQLGSSYLLKCLS